MKTCDYCGEEYPDYDLERKMYAKGKIRLMCYKCRAKGENEVKKHKVKSMEKKGLIGDK
jgi:hypothetical protein